VPEKETTRGGRVRTGPMSPGWVSQGEEKGAVTIRVAWHGKAAKQVADKRGRKSASIGARKEEGKEELGAAR